MRSSRFIIGAFIGISIILGIGGYILGDTFEKDKKILDKLDFLFPLTSQCSYGISEYLDDGFYKYDEDYNITVIDCKGKPIKEYRNYYSYGGKGLFIYEDNNKYGYKNLDGTLLLKAKYDEAQEFNGDYAWVKFQGEGKEAVIDRRGNVVFKGEIGQNIIMVDEDNYMVESYGKKTKVINMRTGKILELDKTYYSVRPDGNGHYIGESNDSKKDFILDKNFVDETDQVLKGLTNKIYDLETFQGKYAATNLGYIDRNYNLVFKKTSEAELGSFSEGKAFIYYDNRIDCVDENFKVLFSKKRTAKGNSSEIFTEFHNGVASISLDGDRKGYIDDKGNWIVKPVFDMAQDVSNGVTAVRYRGKSGVICLKNQ